MPAGLGRLDWAGRTGPAGLGRADWAGWTGPGGLGRLDWARRTGPAGLGPADWGGGTEPAQDCAGVGTASSVSVGRRYAAFTRIGSRPDESVPVFFYEFHRLNGCPRRQDFDLMAASRQRFA